MSHGGRRSGAGRKPGTGRYGEQTKTIRIPISREDEVRKLLTHKISPGEWQKLKQEQSEILRPIIETQKSADLYTVSVQAGLPTAADDAIERKLDLNDHLVQDPKDTFFVRVSGASMTGAHIYDGDLLVVDRKKPIRNGKIIIASVNGELTVKRLMTEKNKIFLYPENPDFPAIEINNECDFRTLGVVTSVIHKVD